MDKFGYIKVMSNTDLMALRKCVGNEYRLRGLVSGYSVDDGEWTTVPSKNKPKNRMMKNPALTPNINREGVQPRFDKKQGKMYQYNRQVSIDETNSVLVRPRQQKGQTVQNVDSNEMRTYLETFGDLKDFETTNRGYFVAEFQKKENARVCFETIKNTDFTIELPESKVSCKVNCRLIKRFSQEPTEDSEQSSGIKEEVKQCEVNQCEVKQCEVKQCEVNNVE